MNSAQLPKANANPSGCPARHLAARVRRAGAIAQVDQLVSQLLDAQPLGQRGG
jgi:hypothetical protein